MDKNKSHDTFRRSYPSISEESLNKIFVQSEEFVTSVVEAAEEVPNIEDKMKLIGSISMMIEIELWEAIIGHYPGY